MSDTLLEIINLNKQLPKGFAINNISFKQNTLQKMAVVGMSGAGKTTLLKMIAGLLQPTSGKVLIDGERVIGPDEKLLPGHKKIGYLSQHYEMLNNYVVKDLIWFENKLSIEEATELFDVCKINHLLQRRTNELSGGEKQRIGLCMLLIKSPKLLVLDEPFSNLDLIHKNILKNVLNEIAEKLQITILLASHDPLDILSWADEIIVMKDGNIIQQANAETIYNAPKSEYVAAMFGAYNLLNKAQMESLAEHFSEDNEHASYIIRPEHITVTRLANAMFCGKIGSIQFYGNYYIANVTIDDFNLKILLHNKEIVIGEMVGLKVDLKKLHKLHSDTIS